MLRRRGPSSLPDEICSVPAAECCTGNGIADASLRMRSIGGGGPPQTSPPGRGAAPALAELPLRFGGGSARSFSAQYYCWFLF